MGPVSTRGTPVQIDIQCLVENIFLTLIDPMRSEKKQDTIMIYIIQSACLAGDGNKTSEVHAAVFRPALGMLRFLYSGWLEAHGETLLLGWSHGEEVLLESHRSP